MKHILLGILLLSSCAYSKEQAKHIALPTCDKKRELDFRWYAIYNCVYGITSFTGFPSNKRIVDYCRSKIEPKLFREVQKPRLFEKTFNL